MRLRDRATAAVSIVMCLIALHTPRLLAQASLTEQDLARIRTEFRDASWEERRKAFYMLLGFETPEKWDGRTYLIPKELDAVFRAHPGDTDDLKLALIQLLAAENSEFNSNKTASETTEEHSDYYGDVIGAVGGLKDPRALYALIGAMGTGDMAANGLAALGPAALDALIEKARSADSQTRFHAVLDLETMWEPEHRSAFSDGVSLKRLETAFLSAANDNNASVRAAGADGLGLSPMPNNETIQTLLKLAISDPAVLPGQADDGGPVYIVRGDAARAIAEIGPAAIRPVIETSGAEDPVIRASAVRALAIMWEPNNRRNFNDSVYKEKFGAIFLKAAADEDVAVRMASVQGLALMANPEAIQALRQLAASDPAKAPGQHDVGVPAYPVRQLASRALDHVHSEIPH